MSTNSARHFLFIVVGVYIVLALAYASATPAWQNPDEPAHYNYARSIADQARLPVLVAGDYDQAALERLKATKFAGHPDISGIRYESYQPPLYYALAGALIALLPGTEHDLRAMRLLSIACGALVLMVIFASGRQIFPEDPLVALGAAALIAFIPQHTAMTAAANNDTLGELLLSLMALLGIRRVNGLADRTFVAAGGILLGLALLTKVTAYVGGVLLVAGELAGWWLARSQRNARFVLGGAGGRAAALRAHLAAVAGIVAIALLISGWWFVRNAMTYGNGDILGLARHDQVVVGQPRTVIGLEAIRHFLVVSFQSFWGVFGWMGVLVDVRIYWLLALLTVIALVGLVIFLARRLGTLSAGQRWGLAILGLEFALIFAVMISLNLMFIQPQGRYLFPASAAIGIFLALGVREMIARPRLLAALAAAGSVALFIVVRGALFLAMGGLAVVIILGFWLASRRVYAAVVWVGLCSVLIVLNIICLVLFIVPALSVG